MKDVVLLTTDEVLSEFDIIKKYIEVAHSKGTCETSLSNMMGKVLTGDINVWVARDNNGYINCVGTTEILNYSNYKAVHLITLGGEDRVNYPEFHKTIEGYARWLKADRITFWGRKAWIKSTDKIVGANNEKYKIDYTVMSMELN